MRSENTIARTQLHSSAFDFTEKVDEWMDGWTDRFTLLSPSWEITVKITVMRNYKMF